MTSTSMSQTPDLVLETIANALDLLLRRASNQQISVNIHEAARLLDLNKKQIMHLIQQGKLKAVRPSPRTILISVKSMREYIDGKER